MTFGAEALIICVAPIEHAAPSEHCRAAKVIDSLATQQALIKSLDIRLWNNTGEQKKYPAKTIESAFGFLILYIRHVDIHLCNYVCLNVSLLWSVG
uniref:Uncharacterized protein n=1 Tax=Bionectria ochroleuca TaxID=29856 RepID=A0A0B7KMJ4_BIOOC